MIMDMVFTLLTFGGWGIFSAWYMLFVEREHFIYLVQSLKRLHLFWAIAGAFALLVFAPLFALQDAYITKRERKENRK